MTVFVVLYSAHANEPTLDNDRLHLTQIAISCHIFGYSYKCEVENTVQYEIMLNVISTQEIDVQFSSTFIHKTFCCCTLAL